MKRKELLAMKKLNATPGMIKVAKENPIEIVAQYTSWRWEYKREVSKYDRYFRAYEENGILKVTVFVQKELQNGKKEPLYEVYIDKANKEFDTYEVSSGKWKSAKINMLDIPSMYCNATNWQQDKDRKLVNKYFDTKVNKSIYAAVLDFQADIRKESLIKKHRSEIEQIEETMREVPELPKGFNEWIKKNCFNEIIFYEAPSSVKKYKWPKMYCTHCESTMDAPSWPKPSHNEEGECPKCHAKTTYKSWNKQKVVSDIKGIGILQRLNDDSGWIVRRFEATIRRNLKDNWQIADISLSENTRARLDDHFQEVERFEYGEYKNTGINRWCHFVKHSAYWGYYEGPYIGRVLMYTPNLKKELERETFCHMDFKQLFKGGKRERVEPLFVLEKLGLHPYIEYLQKSGLTNLVDEIMENRESKELFDRNETRIHSVLKLDKQRFNRLKAINGGSSTLRVLQYEISTGNKVSDETIKWLESLKRQNGTLADVICTSERVGINLQRMLNYLKRQMEINNETLESIHRTYTDYLDMAESFDMDITDEIVCRQPRLMEFHDKYVEKRNREKNRTRDKEVDEKFTNIKANVEKYKKRFEFKTKEYEIVVPAKASDITREGRVLHHCVGASDTYLQRMNGEQSFILFLRRKSNLKRSYYTLEVAWDGNVKQWYSAYDRKPDKDKIQAVLDKFTKKIKKRDMLEKMKEQELAEAN